MVKYAPDFVKQQGDYGTCAGMALSGWAQAWHKKVTGKIVEMSSGYIMAYARQRPHTPTSKGLLFPEDLEGFIRCGTCPAEEFDCNGYTLTCYNAAEAARDRIKTIVKPVGYKSLSSADKALQLARIKEYLDKYQMPLLIITDVIDNGHAILAIDTAGDQVTFLNSYGKQWGTNGTSKLDYRDIKRVYHIWGEETEMKFKDVKPEDWYYEAVKYAYEQGLMKGTSNDTFEPDNRSQGQRWRRYYII